MKNNEYVKCYSKNQEWGKQFKPEGIVIHSTRRNQKFLREYIQPDRNKSNYKELIKLLGRNNHFVLPKKQYYHFWIGADAKEIVRVIETKPLDTNAFNDNYIHICICEDELRNGEYFHACYIHLVVLCANLCKEFGWDADQIFDHSEISPTAVDVNYWFKRFGFNVSKVRNYVGLLLEK